MKVIGIRLIWTVMIFFLFTGCGPSVVSRLEVQRPAKLSIPVKIKRVFIDPKLFNTDKDQLQLRDQVLETLRNELNALGHFQAVVGALGNYDPNRETVGLIQGTVISGREIDQGQGTEKARCTITNSRSVDVGEAITQYNGLPCKRTSGLSDAIEDVGGLFSELVFDVRPAVEEVIRTYRYRNFTMTLQVDFSFTMIGLDRETLALRSDTASYGIRITDPKSYKNVSDSRPILKGRLPALNKRSTVVTKTKPSSYVRWYNQVGKNTKGLRGKDRKLIIRNLIRRTLKPFIKEISPYKSVVFAGVAEGGNGAVIELLKSGKFLQARSTLNQLSEKTGADLYNLGLTHEGVAARLEDYEEALRFYEKALEEEPGVSLYAQGIGRMELRLIEVN